MEVEELDVADGIGSPIQYKKDAVKYRDSARGFRHRKRKIRIAPEPNHANHTRSVYYPPSNSDADTASHSQASEGFQPSLCFSMPYSLQARKITSFIVFSQRLSARNE